MRYCALLTDVGTEQQKPNRLLGYDFNITAFLILVELGIHSRYRRELMNSLTGALFK